MKMMFTNKSPLALLLVTHLLANIATNVVDGKNERYQQKQHYKKRGLKGSSKEETDIPSYSPSFQPSSGPTSSASNMPSYSPSFQPSSGPTLRVSDKPSYSPTTSQPSSSGPTSSVFDDAKVEYFDNYCSEICGVRFVEENLVLTKDYVCDDSTDGPTIGSGATLDCNGHTISCDSATCGFYGVYLSGTSPSIKNCIITGFRYGIFAEAVDIVIENVKVSNNTQYGIEIDEAESDPIVFRKIFATNNGIAGISSASNITQMEDVYSCGNTDDIILSNVDYASVVVDEYIGDVVCDSCDSIPDFAKASCGSTGTCDGASY